MNLLVVIVNFRVAPLLVDCLHSVAAELPRVPGVKVAVCENGSGDGSAQILRAAIDDNRWSDWCTLTVSDVNLGFTGGNNLVIRPALEGPAPPRYVLLLNPDTVVRPRAFAALLDFMERNPKVGIAGSRLEDPDGTPQRSAFRFKSPLGEFEGGLGLGIVSWLLTRWAVAPPVVDHPCETDWVAGASMIVRREVFEQVGLLDEDYFTYFDDIDFCFNARRRGWPTWYVPESRVVHLVGQSTGVTATPKRMPAYVLEARRRYFLKNHDPIYAALVDAGLITGLALARLRAALTGRPDTTPPHLLADSIRHSVFLKGFQLNVVSPPSASGR
ncbi:MAG: glycosyltransferase family 2 protein [Xanthobacteraceae bacterium]|nr:glycosyltransferase family 2 protein [Xanthobacteraceae bacterium]